MTLETAIRERKDAIRKQAHAIRNAQDNKDELSRRIVGAFMALPEYALAKTVMFYIDVRSEVRTRHDLEHALQSGKTIVVPWCNADGELELFRLDSMDELEIGMYKILEPRAELRALAEKQVNVESLDLIMVPGVGFDRRGARMGNGKGYYDKILQHASSNTPLIALAFECQLFDEIPMADHDIFMDKIITEDHIYIGRGRSSCTEDRIDIGLGYSSWTEEKDRRRCALIDRSLHADLTVVEQHELSDLQQQAEAHFDEVAPPPIDGALKIHRQLLKLASTTNK